MTTISARDASRGFSSVLDHVEHDGEEYTIVRDGKAVARIVPVTGHTLGDLLAARAGEPPIDEDFADDVLRVRDLLITDSRDPWHD